jgi:hypothetical protein
VEKERSIFRCVCCLSFSCRHCLISPSQQSHSFPRLHSSPSLHSSPTISPDACSLLFPHFLSRLFAPLGNLRTGPGINGLTTSEPFLSSCLEGAQSADGICAVELAVAIDLDRLHPVFGCAHRGRHPNISTALTVDLVHTTTGCGEQGSPPAQPYLSHHYQRGQK